MNSIKTAVIIVRVQPSSKVDEFVGMMDNHVIKIKIKAKPIEGNANTALVEFLSKILDINKRDLEIVAGKNSRLKTIRISGIEKRELDLRLQKLCNH
jgi:hypothetical protein